MPRMLREAKLSFSNVVSKIVAMDISDRSDSTIRTLAQGHRAVLDGGQSLCLVAGGGFEELGGRAPIAARYCSCCPHHFADGPADYAGIIQGFALVGA